VVVVDMNIRIKDSCMDSFGIASAVWKVMAEMDWMDEMK